MARLAGFGLLAAFALLFFHDHTPFAPGTRLQRFGGIHRQLRQHMAQGPATVVESKPKQEPAKGAEAKKSDVIEEVADAAIAEAAMRSSVTEKESLDMPGGEWTTLAQQARQMGKQAEGKVDDKDKNTRYSARSTKTLSGWAASTFDVAEANAVPTWAPFAAMGGAALLAAIVAISSAFTAPREPPPLAVKGFAAPAVVQVQPPTAVAPAAPAAPVAPATKAAALAVPWAAPAAPMPPPRPAAERFDWARKLTNGTAEALRAVANGLPQAELALEAKVPAIESGARWVADVRPENIQDKMQEALPVVGKALAQGTETAARSGLRAVATGLNVAAEELPDFGTALRGAVTSGMPGFQSGVHSAASFSRDLSVKAAELSRPGALPSDVPGVARQVLGLVPGVFDVAAGGLDLLADNAPGIERAIEYAARKAEPILHAALGATSQVVNDASTLDIPGVDAKELANSLRAFGVDPDRMSVEAQAMVRDALFKGSNRLLSLNIVAAAPVSQGADVFQK